MYISWGYMFYKKKRKKWLTYPKEVLDYVAHRITRCIEGFGFLRDRFCHDMSDGSVHRWRTVVHLCPPSIQKPEWQKKNKLDSYRSVLWVNIRQGGSSPFEHGSSGGLLDHEKNSPALESTHDYTFSYLFPPRSDGVKSSWGAGENGHFIGSLRQPGAILHAFQHIVWSHNPLSWEAEVTSLSIG